MNNREFISYLHNNSSKLTNEYNLLVKEFMKNYYLVDFPSYEDVYVEGEYKIPDYALRFSFGPDKFFKDIEKGIYEKVIDESKKCVVATYKSERNGMEYNVREIFDEKNDIYEFILNPVIQNGISSGDFCESFKICYDIKKAVLEASKLSYCRDGSLMSQNRKYLFDSKTQELILFNRVKTYCFSSLLEIEKNHVNKMEENYLSLIYNSGKLLISEDVIQPSTNNLFVTSNKCVFPTEFYLEDKKTDYKYTYGTICYNTLTNEVTLYSMFDMVNNRDSVIDIMDDDSLIDIEIYNINQYMRESDIKRKEKHKCLSKRR